MLAASWLSSLIWHCWENDLLLHAMCCSIKSFNFEHAAIGLTTRPQWHNSKMRRDQQASTNKRVLVPGTVVISGVIHLSINTGTGTCTYIEFKITNLLKLNNRLSLCRYMLWRAAAGGGREICKDEVFLSFVNSVWTLWTVCELWTGDFVRSSSLVPHTSWLGARCLQKDNRCTALLTWEFINWGCNRQSRGLETNKIT